jgi:hypothetical protein
MIWITLWKKLCALCSCKKETDTPMARDPRTVPPSEVHANRRPRVTSRRAYVDQLIARSSVLAAPLADLPDLAIGLEKVDAYNAVNSSRLTDAVARVLTSFAQRDDVPRNLIRALVTNITSEATAVGYAAQLQGYDWLLRQGATFSPEIEHTSTLRNAKVALDGRFEERHGAAFFDIKSYAFEPQLRATVKRRLEQRLPGATIAISGPGNYVSDDLEEHVFGQLDHVVDVLRRDGRIRITDLDWDVVAHGRTNGVVTSTVSYDHAVLAVAEALMPIRFASQFTVDAPYILIFVLAYGFGGNPLPSTYLVPGPICSTESQPMFSALREPTEALRASIAGRCPQMSRLVTLLRASLE